jgi:thioredoxin-like negative regulator of GroEL
MPLIPLRNQAMLEDMLRPRGKNSVVNEDGSVKTYTSNVLIAFGASWCGPCKKLNKELIAQRVPSAVVYYCDVDENEDSLQYCGLSKIPSFALIVDGIFKGVLEGPKNEMAVFEWLLSQGVDVEKIE